MNSRTEFGIHLSLATGLVGVWALAVLLLGESGWVTGVVVTVIAATVTLAGMRLVVTRGVWSPRLTVTETRRAALFGVAWGPAAALAVALFGWWPVSVLALPVPALLAAFAVSLWPLLPEPLRAFLRFFRHFS